jgi:DNA-binding GntR family transcriptional regulator
LAFTPAWLRRAGKEHWAIIEAIRAHDQDAAVKATDAHTASTAQYLIQCLQSDAASQRAQAFVAR